MFSFRLPFVGAGLVTGLGHYFYTHEEFGRSLIFWKTAMPLFLHYRYIEWQTKLLPEEEQKRIFKPLHVKYAPQINQLILNLRGFYIKIGQVVSSRSDFVPQDYIDLLSSLQDSVPEEPFDAVQRTFRSSTGLNIDDVFEWFDEKPIGAASIGQVHRARLREDVMRLYQTQAQPSIGNLQFFPSNSITSRDVVVKVMYPSVEGRFRGDFEAIRTFCELAQPEHLPALNEIRKQFITEFNYVREAGNLRRVHDNIGKSTWNNLVKVPTPILASRHVLVMELIPGKKLVTGLLDYFKLMAEVQGMTMESMMSTAKHAKPLSRQQVDWLNYSVRLSSSISNLLTAILNSLTSIFGHPSQPFRRDVTMLNMEDLIRTLFQVHGHEVFVDLEFNGDPHPGNILLMPDGRLGLIDYGQVKRISKQDVENLSRLVIVLANPQSTARQIADVYHSIGLVSRDMNPQVAATVAYMMFNCEDISTLGGLNIQTCLEVLNRIDPITSLPEDLIMVVRLSLLLRGLAYALGIRVNVCETWLPYAQASLGMISKTQLESALSRMGGISPLSEPQPNIQPEI